MAETSPSPTPAPANNSGSTEFQLARLNHIVGIVMIAAGMLYEALSSMSLQMPLPHWVGAVLAGLGVLLKLGTALGYSAGRATVKAAQAQAKGYASLRLLVALVAASLLACATLSALSGSTGPIPVTSGKDAAGATITTSTVTVTAQPVSGTAPNCQKPVSVSFDTVTGYHNACSVDVPVPPVAGVCQRFEPACFCW